MPELPEIASRARELRQEIIGLKIQNIEILQDKCLNLPVSEFIERTQGTKIIDVTYHGKWIYVKISSGWLLINLGMGGEILLTTRGNLPEKYRLLIDFDNSLCLAINFWWFGNVHYAPENALSSHKPTAKLGPNAVDISDDHFLELLDGRRGGIKSFLLNQSQIAGIGNAHIHEILFSAGIHPLQLINSLSEQDKIRLNHAIKDMLIKSLDKGGDFYELDIYGKPGGYSMEDRLIGYKEDQLCPNCSTLIEKIKTGSTSSYICPVCQELK
jgi:formamidopyrimidine-DNA glycosylase